MQPLAGYGQSWLPPAAQVLECIQQMGERHSNPVLELLQDVADFVQGGKYPQPALVFGDAGWRSYYHSHSMPDADAGEHGHFHLFTRNGRGWMHLAALAMDRDGQPLRWFITNRWVTGSDWGERGNLVSAIDALVPANEPDLLRQWLTGLLKLYKSELDGLLDTRDSRIAELLPGRSQDDVFGDRTLYELACRPVDLAAKLTSQLTGESL